MQPLRLPGNNWKKKYKKNGKMCALFPTNMCFLILFKDHPTAKRMFERLYKLRQNPFLAPGTRILHRFGKRLLAKPTRQKKKTCVQTQNPQEKGKPKEFPEISRGIWEVKKPKNLRSLNPTKIYRHSLNVTVITAHRFTRLTKKYSHNLD